MSIQSVLINQLKCCFENDGHIAIEPVILKCGGNGCKQCIENSKEALIPCFGCNKTHDKNKLVKAALNKFAEEFIKLSLNDLLNYVNMNTESMVEKLKGFHSES